jgi:hypothetical protein
MQNRGDGAGNSPIKRFNGWGVGYRMDPDLVICGDGVSGYCDAYNEEDCYYGYMSITDVDSLLNNHHITNSVLNKKQQEDLPEKR